MISREPRDCGDCRAKPGEFHEPGCDVERCERCGYQRIACDCVYEVNGIDVGTMEDTHPDVYRDGPTEAMWDEFDEQYSRHRKPWSGIWPGVEECREYGMYARMLDGKTGWHRCGPDDTGAMEALTPLVLMGRWDVERQRFVMSPEALARFQQMTQV